MKTQNKHLKQRKITKIILFVLLITFLQSCVVKTKTVAHHKKHKIVYVKAPKHHRIIVVKGKKYHYWNGKHYQKTKKGFVFVRVN